MFAFIKARHRRAASSTASPQSPASQWQPPSPDDVRPATSPTHDLHPGPLVLHVPPVLPPIPRVALQEAVPEVSRTKQDAGLRGQRHGASQAETFTRAETAEHLTAGARSNLPPQQENSSLATDADVQDTRGLIELRRLQIEPRHSLLTEPSLQRAHSPARYHQSGFAASAVAHRPAVFKSSASSPNTNVPKTSKGKLILRNPMSLLMQRRSVQADFVTDDGPTRRRNIKVPAMDLPADYNPSIKGNVIHDFSAPRPVRNQSSNEFDSTLLDWRKSNNAGTLEGGESASVLRGRGAVPARQGNGGKEHSPHFYEHFKDDSDLDRGRDAVQAEVLADSAFVARVEALEMAEGSGPIPPFASRVVQAKVEQQRNSDEYHKQGLRLPTSTVIYDGNSTSSNMSERITPELPRATRNKSNSTRASRLPRQSGSTSSRFSFAGVASTAQEKFLEERYRSKAAAEVSDGREIPGNELDQDSLYDPEIDDDDEGIEERVPGINADYEASAGDTVPEELQATRAERPRPSESPSSSYANASDLSDDMYFDDGMIDDAGPAEDVTVVRFDESLLDMAEVGQSPFLCKDADIDAKSKPPLFPAENNPHDPRKSLPLLQVPQYGEPELAESLAMHRGELDLPQELEESEVYTDEPGEEHARLYAYHGALANAAAKAAADGRFSRKDSILSDDTEYSGLIKQKPESLRHNGFESRAACAEEGISQPAGVWNTVPEDDDIDDSLEDEIMVTAANAEALACDEDGFYGQEFGFYAHAQAQGNSEAIFFNGGYFGPNGMDLGRRKSTREPDLTPITERSEFSTRNSFISLHNGLHGPNSAQSYTSPGLSQLAMISPFPLENDEMTLEQLMRLRRDTFGGSDGVFQSTNSSPILSSTMSPFYLNNPHLPSHLHSSMSRDPSSRENDFDAYEEPE